MANNYDDYYENPDRTQSDYYCPLCESHMNSAQMWESHITGKRHLKNTKKQPGEGPSKVKSVKVNRRAILEDELKDIGDTIVGLRFICETQRPNLQPAYNCYLCNSQLTQSIVVDHILSAKHRANFLKEINRKTFDDIMSLKLSKNYMEQLVLEKCDKFKESVDVDIIEVKMEKPKLLPGQSLPRYSSRSYRSDEVEKDSDLVAPEKGGIRELDVFGDNLSGQMLVDLAHHMIKKKPLTNVKTEEDKVRYWKNIQCLNEALDSAKIKILSYDEQQKLLNKLMYYDVNKRPIVKIVGLDGLK